MDEETRLDFLNPNFLFDTLCRRRWIIIIALLLSGLVCFYLSLTLPKIYSASTVIMIQPQKVPEKYVRSLVTQGVESRISTISHEIQSRVNLEKIIEQFELFSSQEGHEISIDEKIEELKTNIRVHLTTGRRKSSGGGTNAFSITYDDPIPEQASKIANALATQFINENLKIREAQAIGTSGFLDEELAAMRRRLQETEQQLIDYRHQHMGELPSQLESNLRQLDRLQNEFADRQKVLSEARMRLVALLDQTPSPSSPNNDQPVDLQELQGLSYTQLQSRLFQLQSRYTDKHPDIIRLKQMMAEYPRGPETLQGESQIVVDTRNEILEYQKDLADIRQKIAFYQNRVEKIPQREQELLSLKRDYNNMRQSYQSLLDRKLEAEIAVNMERKQKGEQFRLLDPAIPPTNPILPDIKKLLAIALVSGLGVAGGICYLLEYLIQVFRRPEEIEANLGIPLVATIPILPSRKRACIKHINTAMTVAASAVVCVVYGLFGALIFLGESELMSIVNNYLTTIN